MSLDAGWVRLPLIAGLTLLAGARFVLSATYFSDETEGQMKGDKPRYSVKHFLFHLFETVWNGLAGALVAGILADGVSSYLWAELQLRDACVPSGYRPATRSCLDRMSTAPCAVEMARLTV